MSTPQTSSNAWHAPANLLDRFVADPGEVDSATAASIEAHLVACERCRDAVTERVGGGALEASWRRVADVIDRPRLSLIERMMVRSGVSESTARLLAGTPALTVAALGSAVVVAVGAVASSRVTDTSGTFLVVAPLLPLLAVAAAFASVADPVGETAVPTPLHGIGLVLRRAAVIVTAVFAVLGVADLAIGDLDAPVIAWLLPALALPTAALALGTWIRAEVASSTLAVGWVVVLFAVRWVDGWQTGYADTATFGPPGQLTALAVLAAAVAVLVARRDQFQLLDGVR